MLDRQRMVKVSKYLSKHLRHQPERLGLELEPGGWVAVDALLQACAAHAFPRSREELDQVVAILASGLQRRDRHHVHLSPDVDTATRVGRRHGKPVVFTVDAARMAVAGHLFHVSENGVWLV